MDWNLIKKIKIKRDHLIVESRFIMKIKWIGIGLFECFDSF